MTPLAADPKLVSVNSALPYAAVLAATGVTAVIVGLALALIDGRTTLREWMSMWSILLVAIVVVAALVAVTAAA